MNGSLSIGQYIPRISIIHKLNPASKMIIFALFVVCTVLADRPLLYAFGFIFLFFVIVLSEVSFKMIFKSLKTITGVLVVTSLINLFLVQGNDDDLLVKLGFIKIYSDGIEVAVQLLIRLVLMLTMSFLLTVTTSPTELTAGIRLLMRPLGKVRAENMTMMIIIGLSFIPVLREELRKITNAQKARGADIDSGGIIKRVKSLAPLVVPLFLNSLKRAEELASAMESRGYTGDSCRTQLAEITFGLKDAAALTVSSALLILCILVRVI